MSASTSCVKYLATTREIKRRRYHCIHFNQFHHHFFAIVCFARFFPLSANAEPSTPTAPPAAAPPLENHPRPASLECQDKTAHWVSRVSRFLQLHAAGVQVVV